MSGHDIPDGPFYLPPDETVDTEFGPMTFRYRANRGSFRPMISLGTELDVLGPQSIMYNGTKVSFTLTLTDEGFGFERGDGERGEFGASLRMSEADERSFIDALTRIANRWAVGKDDVLIAAALASAGQDILEFRQKLEETENRSQELRLTVRTVEQRYKIIRELGTEHEYRDSCRRRKSV